jgi:hypothetical protein
LVDVVADLARDPGGETITQARHAQVDLAARELWVPNGPSMAVTCDIAGQWLSDMIVGHGGTTALSDLPAARGVARTAGP